jgi:hypothetical protein
MTEEDPRAGYEAARLLAAAQDWLASAAPHLAPVDDEGRTCPCPLCRVVATVREADPEEVGRWVDAAVAGFGAALRDVVATEHADPEPEPGRTSLLDTDTEPDTEPDAEPDAEPDDSGRSGSAAIPRVRRIPVDPTSPDPTSPDPTSPDPEDPR